MKVTELWELLHSRPEQFQQEMGVILDAFRKDPRIYVGNLNMCKIIDRLVLPYSKNSVIHSSYVAELTRLKMIIDDEAAVSDMLDYTIAFHKSYPLLYGSIIENQRTASLIHYIGSYLNLDNRSLLRTHTFLYYLCYYLNGYCDESSDMYNELLDNFPELTTSKGNAFFKDFNVGLLKDGMRTSQLLIKMPRLISILNKYETDFKFVYLYGNGVTIFSTQFLI